MNTDKIFAYSFGLSSTLVVGIGMCLSMEQIGVGRHVRKTFHGIVRKDASREKYILQNS